MIPVKVDQLFLSNVGFVVMLKSQAEADTRSLPIFIGAAEAQAIALHINGMTVPRPLTHDLLKNLLDFVECRLLRIEVCDLKDGTFFAKLVLDKDGNTLILDSRPSDAIALALRCATPIYVHNAVMNEAGRVFTETEDGLAEVPPQTSEDAHLSPLSALQKKLDEAVAGERYEDAAKLRDEIAKMQQGHSHN